MLAGGDTSICLHKVLLVEDDPAHMLILLDMVTELFPTAQIRTALDGYNALAIAPQFQPDAIISDVSMPHASGLSFLHALLPALASQPKVLVLTGFDRQQLARMGPLPSQAQLLKKPATMAQLRAATADWF